MELMYPIAIIIMLVISIAIFFWKLKSKEKYTYGKKVANTKFVQETEYYKKKVRKYKNLTMLIKILYVACIVLTGILISRPIKIITQSDEKYNRDVILSIDLSASQDEVNLEFVKKFRKIISNLNGDRIGIILFNTAPIVYCPLTEDYNYIDECLGTIEKQLKLTIENGGSLPYDKKDHSAQVLFEGGVVAGSETRGSSLIGDGLARNYIFFSRYKDE